MTEQKHTPLPWGLDTAQSALNFYTIHDVDYNTIVHVCAFQNSKHDAEFIVKACNSYYTTRRDTLLEVILLLEETASYGSQDLDSVIQEIREMAEEGK